MRVHPDICKCQRCCKKKETKKERKKVVCFSASLLACLCIAVG